MGNPHRSQQIMPDKGLFLEAEKKPQLCMPTFSSSNCALNIPALWPEIDGTEVESWVRGQMDQPWPSLVSKSAFLSEVVQKGPLHPGPLPSFSKHTPIHPTQPFSTKECVPCGARAALGHGWGSLSQCVLVPE